MKYFLPITAVLLIGCGHHSSGPTTSAPPPTPFADVAGNYLATVTATSGSYNALYTVGDSQTATITAQGNVAAGTSIYVLSRHPDGSFQIYRKINATTAEIGFAPPDLSQVVIEYHDYVTITGTITWALVKTGGG